MSYLKSAVIGVLVAVMFSLVWVIATVVLPIASMFLRPSAEGSGGIGFVSASSGPVLLVAVAGFAAGFYWDRRRRNRPAPL